MKNSPNINFEEIKSIKGVKNVHHFHAWRVGKKLLYSITHMNVQIEYRTSYKFLIFTLM